MIFPKKNFSIREDQVDFSKKNFSKTNDETETNTADEFPLLELFRSEHKLQTVFSSLRPRSGDPLFRSRRQLANIPGGFKQPEWFFGVNNAPRGFTD